MKEQLLAILENSKNYTVEVASVMPDSSYAFKPVETAWAFGDLLHHIAYGIHWWGDNYVRETKTEWAPPPVNQHKKDILAYLDEAYTELEKTIGTMKLSEDVVKGFHATLDHITHHRGQAVLYLRCNGLTPPEYVY
jgi:uncharacterized damage-inducible protein DinB